jgi:hypothetical protein
MLFIERIQDISVNLGFETLLVNNDYLRVEVGGGISYVLETLNSGDIFIVSTFDDEIGDNELIDVEIQDYFAILETLSLAHRIKREVEEEFSEWI